MSIRGLLIGLVLLGVLAGAVYWSERKTEADEAAAAKGENRLVEMEEADVRRIELQPRDAAAVILERKDGNWQMLAPETWRVDQSQANNIAGAYARLSYDRVVEEKATALQEYGLESPPFRLSFTDKNGKARTLLIGDDTPTGAAVYAKLHDDPRVFTIDSTTRASMAQTPQDLRDKRLLVFNADELSRVTLAGKGQPVEFGRVNETTWQITKPMIARADNFQVEELVRKLGDVRMDAAAPDDAARAQSAFAGGTRIGSASVVDKSGEHTLEVRKRGEDYYARSSSTSGIFKISSESGEALNKGLEDFRNKKLFDFGFTEPSSVTMRDGEKTYAFTKEGDKWRGGGKEMDPTSVQGLIDRLRDLSAIKFVTAAFTAPTIEVTVKSGEKNQVEKVLISKTGNSYFAQREGEPAIYELESKAVEELQRAAADVKAPPPPTPAAK